MYMGEGECVCRPAPARQAPGAEKSGSNVAVQNLPRGRPGFVLWMRQAMPEVYERIKNLEPELVKVDVRRGTSKGGALDYEGYNYDTGNYLLYGLGAAETAAPADAPKTWADRLADLAAPLVQAYQQKKILDIQLERAKNNLPPLDAGSLATQVKVQVEPSKALLGSIGKYALPIGAGVLFLLLRRR